MARCRAYDIIESGVSLVLSLPPNMLTHPVKAERVRAAVVEVDLEQRVLRAAYPLHSVRPCKIQQQEAGTSPKVQHTAHRMKCREWLRVLVMIDAIA